MSDFAYRLRNLRQMLELSPQALAQVCGISYESQQAYEAGLVGPNARYLQALADAGLEVAYLTAGEFPSPRPEGVDRKTFVFLENYRRCTPAAQAEIFLELMIAAAPNHARQEQEAARARCDQPRIAANDDGFE